MVWQYFTDSKDIQDTKHTEFKPRVDSVASCFDYHKTAKSVGFDLLGMEMDLRCLVGNLSYLYYSRDLLQKEIS